MTNTTLFIGRNLIELPTIDSTNNYAKEMLNEQRPPEGTCVLTHEQTSGRGQMGNTWHSEPGKNITLSLILYPTFLDVSKQFFLSMAVALAVKDFCESVLQDEAKIKWPNDIYFGDNKLGGVLIENNISGSKITSSAIGIGINVNQKTFGAGAKNATSLCLVSGEEQNLKNLTGELFFYFEKYYLQLRQLHFNFLDKAYTVGMYRYQQTHEFKKGNQLFKGEIVGVAKDGKLIIQSGEKEFRFGFKEVEYVL
jgi:BirA family biotin operon repressor/biotin-[acetyl-CoA-carboxylase] ligase